MNLAYLSSMDLSKGRISKSLKRADEREERSEKREARSKKQEERREKREERREKREEKRREKRQVCVARHQCDSLWAKTKVRLDPPATHSICSNTSLRRPRISENARDPVLFEF